VPTRRENFNSKTSFKIGRSTTPKANETFNNPKDFLIINQLKVVRKY